MTTREYNTLTAACVQDGFSRMGVNEFGEGFAGSVGTIDVVPPDEWPPVILTALQLNHFDWCLLESLHSVLGLASRLNLLDKLKLPIIDSERPLRFGVFDNAPCQLRVRK